MDRSKRLEDWLAARGITRPEIKDDFEDFVSEEQARALFPEDLTRNQRADLSKKINWLKKDGGFFIHRKAPPGDPQLTPEIKTWNPMLGRKRVHYHGEPTDEPLYNPESGKRLHPIQILTPHQARAHIDGKWHEGDNSDKVDVHVPEQKYTLLATAKVRKTRQHTHRKMFEQNHEKFLFHLLKQHAFGRVPELDEPHPVEYVEKVPGDHKRFDVPLPAVRLFRDAKLVHLVLEGPTKTRSVLEEILDQRSREAVCGILSVTMFDRDDLERLVFLFNLDKTRPRFMVWVDSDARDPRKPVMGHAKTVQWVLNELGFEADIALPPGSAKVGPDDHRGKGNSLDSCIVVGECRTLYGFSEVLAENKSVSYTNRSDAVERDAELCRYLAHNAHPVTGDYALPPLRTIASHLGWDRGKGGKKAGYERVRRSLRSLLGWAHNGRLGPSGGVIDLVSGTLDSRKNYWSGEPDWKDPPIINVHPLFRAVHGDDWRLGALRHQLRKCDSRETRHSLKVRARPSGQR